MAYITPFFNIITAEPEECRRLGRGKAALYGEIGADGAIHGFGLQLAFGRVAYNGGMLAALLFAVYIYGAGHGIEFAVELLQLFCCVERYGAINAFKMYIAAHAAATR